MSTVHAPPAEPPAVSASRAPGGAGAQTRWGWAQILVVVVAALGVGILVYPSAASWFSALKHDTDVDGYVQSITDLSGGERTDVLAEAREYNDHLPAGPLRDPYALGPDGQQTAVGDGAAAYFRTLKVPGTEAMARLRIPAIDLDLPVYHGTDEATLARGVGHLYGSALPVGGVGSHAVLTGHSGLVDAVMFDDIDDLVAGDEIIVSVMGEDLSYEVDQIKTVVPDDAEALRQIPGGDYLSLVTCTPTGVNTHRLLVRAVRVDAPAAAEDTTTVVADDGPAAGFPWWAVLLIGVPLAAFAVVRPRPASLSSVWRG